MALMRCEQGGRTGSPKKHSKVAPTQDIALFLHSSTKMVASLKYKFFFLKRSICLDTLKSGLPYNDNLFRDQTVFEH